MSEPAANQPVTHAEYGAMLWHLCTKFTLEFTKTFPFEPSDKETLNGRVIEILSLHLWTALKAVGTDDTEALDELHRLYLESVAKDLAPGTPIARLKDQLLARYGEYFQAWKEQGDETVIQRDFAAVAAAHVFGGTAPDGAKFMGWIFAALAATVKMRSELEFAP